MMLSILISVLLAPGSYFAGAAGAGAPLLRSATTTPRCGAGSPALIAVALAPASYAICTGGVCTDPAWAGAVCTAAVCTAPICTAAGVAVRPSMANASVGMIFMRAFPDRSLLLL